MGGGVCVSDAEIRGGIPEWEEQYFKLGVRETPGA